MTFDPARHHRRSIRLPGHGYDRGVYFLTIRAKRAAPSLGRIDGGCVRLTSLGEIVDNCWRSIPDHHTGVTLDEWVVMPDHLHGILVIDRLDSGGGGNCRVERIGPPNGPEAGTLGLVVGTSKAAVTRSINAIRATPGATFWQRNYYEHIIRNANDLKRVRHYIVSNPARWDRRRRGDICVAPT